MAGALLTTAACALDLLSPFALYFSLPMIWYKHQYWRLVTNFFFFGANFSLDFLFHMFFLVRYCRALEEGSFRGRTADFFFLILFGATLMTLVAPLVNLHFLGSSLTFMMVYIWARRNPFARMNFLGLFTFTAPYLPWVLLSFSFLLGNNGLVDMVGICVGHLYYFCEDVYPLMLPSRKRLLKTPHILELLFTVNEEQPFNHPEIIPEAQLQEQLQGGPQPHLRDTHRPDAEEQPGAQAGVGGEQGQPQRLFD